MRPLDPGSPKPRMIMLATYPRSIASPARLSLDRGEPRGSRWLPEEVFMGEGGPLRRDGYRRHTEPLGGFSASSTNSVLLLY
jgi:hypothetical protein